MIFLIKSKLDTVKKCTLNKKSYEVSKWKKLLVLSLNMYIKLLNSVYIF